MRKALLAFLLAVVASLFVTPAHAETAPNPASFTDSHGRLTFRITNPTHRTWFADVAVDTHFGFSGSPDIDADSIRAVGRISKGTGAIRVQVNKLRLGAENGSFVTDDVNISANRLSSNNGLTPSHPLNSGTGSQALGYSDWRVSPCDSPRVATRAFFSVRWANGTLTSGSFRSNYVDPDPNGCAPPPPPDCKVSQATLSDRPDSGFGVEQWALDNLTRTTKFCQTAPGVYHETITDTGTFKVNQTINPGMQSPAPADVIICQDVTGSISGHASADFTAAADWVSYNPAGMIGSFSGTAPRSTSTWPQGFFSDAAGSLINNDWSWTYTSDLGTTSHEVWVNFSNAAGDAQSSGDITGAPCPNA